MKYNRLHCRYTKAMEDLQIERLERKVDMSLDEIIKMQKKSNRKAKKSTRKPFLQRKNAYQVSAASQSSNQQAKSGEAISRHGASTSRAAARRASFRNNRLKARMQNWKQSHRASGGAGANKNVRIQILNESSRTRRFPIAMRKGKAMERLSWASDKVPNGKRTQTLDSRFASLKNRRQQQQSGEGSSHAVLQKRAR